MSCLENENVCSVKKENNSGYYRLHTIWRKDGFFINITSKNGAWRGEMTPNDVTEMSVKLEMEPESYLQICKEALTCHGGQSGMVYAVEDGCFAWKKVEDEDSGIKIKIGSVMLEPTNFIDTIQNLVTAALNCNKNLQEKLMEVTNKKDQLLESRNELINQLNELRKTKEMMETDLYERFVLLINTKKKKLLDMENLLEKLLKENKNILSENLKNPFEIDTESDSENEIIKTIPTKVKTNTNTSDQKKIRKSCFLPKEVPEEKKLKKNTDSEKSNFECSSYSFQPSTSKLESEKNTSRRNFKKIPTKDELFDYFYGEI